MFRLKLVRNLKTALWLFVVALIPATLLTLYWANQTGLPDNWRSAIEQEISKHGVHIEIGAMSYIPLQGFVARNVRVFAEEERIHEISNLERVQLVLDYTDLASGKFRLRKIELRNAALSVLVEPKNPAGESLQFSQIYGTIFMPDEKLIEMQNIRAVAGGIELSLNAKLHSNRKGDGKYDDYKNDGHRRELVAIILKELEKWSFDPESSPKLQVDLRGQVSEKESLEAEFYFQANSLEKSDYRLNQINANGSLAGNLLTVSTFSAIDARGEISGNADYQISNHDGRFDIESSIDITRLLGSWFAIPIQINLLSGGSQQLAFSGDFNLSEATKPKINLTGHALCESIMFRGVSFDTLETWFSWQDGNLFLRDFKVVRPDGSATGKILKDRNIIQIKLESTLPVSLYKPFFIDKPLEKIIADFTETKDSRCDLSIEGSFNTEDHFAWAFSGNGKVANVSYRDVPLKAANCSFVLNQNEFDFYDGKVNFNYENYSLRKTYDGPSSGTASIGRIRYDRKSKLIGVNKVSGKVWAAPLLRMFVPKIADNLEKYRFHRPPSLTGEGLIDVTPQGRTNLEVSFNSATQADYLFLGKDITLTKPSASVKIRGKEVVVSDLKADVMSGDIQADFKHSAGQLTGELSWTKIQIPALESTYNFNIEGGGNVTGRIEFEMNADDLSTMQGKGLVAMEQAELFSVPMFGPLSTLVSKIVGDKRFGHERAKSAFCNFTIEDGIAKTQDFKTTTSSLRFTGDGAINLTDKTVDFTIRLNARGLLGLITLPLRPFYGLFQFRGTGPLKDPEWKNVRFTSPPEQQSEILLDPPKAQAVPD